jgi:hypothetical protein
MYLSPPEIGARHGGGPSLDALPRTAGSTLHRASAPPSRPPLGNATLVSSSFTTRLHAFESETRCFRPFRRTQVGIVSGWSAPGGNSIRPPGRSVTVNFVAPPGTEVHGSTSFCIASSAKCPFAPTSVPQLFAAIDAVTNFAVSRAGAAAGAGGGGGGEAAHAAHTSAKYENDLRSMPHHTPTPLPPSVPASVPYLPTQRTRSPQLARPKSHSTVNCPAFPP